MNRARRTRAGRVATIKALLAGRGFLGVSQQIVLYEYDQVVSVERVPVVRRRHLLQVLHSTRGLDTALSRLVVTFCTGTSRSLGQSLHRLRNNAGPSIASLPEQSRIRYQTNIVEHRNRYMHEAGAFPSSDTEVDNLLSEMEFCIAEILSL